MSPKTALEVGLKVDVDALPATARKAVFKKIAGQTLIDFGYEKDLNW